MASNEADETKRTEELEEEQLTSAIEDEEEEEEEGPTRNVIISFRAKCPSEYKLTDIRMAILNLADNEPEFDEVSDVEVNEA
jgi:hypothetical protein